MLFREIVIQKWFDVGVFGYCLHKQDGHQYHIYDITGVLVQGGQHHNTDNTKHIYKHLPSDVHLENAASIAYLTPILYPCGVYSYDYVQHSHNLPQHR
jgi:hypothetical protein